MALSLGVGGNYWFDPALGVGPRAWVTGQADAVVFGDSSAIVALAPVFSVRSTEHRDYFWVLSGGAGYASLTQIHSDQEFLCFDNCTLPTRHRAPAVVSTLEAGYMHHTHRFLGGLTLRYDAAVPARGGAIEPQSAILLSVVVGAGSRRRRHWVDSPP